MLKVGTDCLSHELRATGQRERYEYFTAFSPSTCKFNSFSFWSVCVNYSCAGMRWVYHRRRERERVSVCFICSLMQAHNLHSPACLCHLSALKFTKIKRKYFYVLTSCHSRPVCCYYFCAKHKQNFKNFALDSISSLCKLYQGSPRYAPHTHLRPSHSHLKLNSEV